MPAATAGLCAVLAALPGLPAWPFLSVGALAGAAAARARRRRPGPGASPAAGGTRAGTRSPAVEALEGAPPPLVLELSPDLAALDGPRPGRLRSEVWPALGAELARELGVRLPALGLRVAALPPGRWQLLLDEVPAAWGLSPAGEAVALLPPAELQAVGIEALAELDPLTGQLVARIAAADAARAHALTPLRSPLERVAAGLAAALRDHAHLLLGVQEVQGLLEELEGSHPALVRESSRQLSVTLLAEVLRRLLEEGVPIRPLPLVLEALVAAGGGARGAEALAEAARRALRRQLAHRLAPRGPLEAIVVDAAAEAALRTALAGAGGSMPLQPGLTLLERLGSELARVEPWQRPVLLASADVRRALRDLLAPRFPRLVVVAYDELPPVQAVRPVGRLGLDGGEADGTGRALAG